ncbi:ADP-ribose pyrophosphatase YjhB (NUDIX family) [Nocardioides cavernae]|uniref:ADP-ribose pyrophosphatase YjhB (NUDIX family) n=1 Tax=Nocardioides cavernae TaxID=1921566 RepID=A0A7Y9KMT5_9ACTN|nr:NUDIX domain-containing protein [Nocardioides cavernae]NYE35021.1 ADP-ribose pyrophosphatase YjhB (NUDIX family) [Nocardioides cavernae]
MAPIDRSVIRVKAMLIAPNEDFTTHAVSVNPPTQEHPTGYHRLIGGGVELGETHRDAIVREVHEELGAAIRHLSFVAAVENIFHIDGTLGHEVVFVHLGRLDPAPALEGASLIESDGSEVPVVWRPVDDRRERLPLFPSAAADLVRDPGIRRSFGAGGRLGR